MARVLLIKPRFMTGPEFQSITHPLGLMYVGAALKAAGHSPRIHDCVRDRRNFSELKRIIKEWQPDVVGLSFIVSEVEEAGFVLSAVRSLIPDVPVVFGGPGPSANPGGMLAFMGADYVIQGEGERVFPEMVNAIGAGRSPSWVVENIPGVTAMCDGKPAGGHPAPLLSEDELDRLPFPAWDLIDHKIYARTTSMATVGRRPYMTIITSRGCPFHCVYCHQTVGKQFRKRSPESVLAEIDEIQARYGIGEFEIVDDCFNLDHQRMCLILEGLRKGAGKIRLHFPNGVRADQFESGDMRLLRQAGTVSACFAVETAAPRLQKLIRKNLDMDRTVNTINAAVDENIYTTSFFMVGLPTETFEEARQTVDFAVKSRIHRALFMLATPFPGTELAEMAREIIKAKKLSGSLNSLNYYNNSLNISAMTDEELQKIFRMAYRKFFMNPRHVFRLLAHHPKAASLPRYGLITLIKMIPGLRRVRA
ncbi:MAG: B12-binding domain-containing radical SAM protein [Thermodesulfobacteriota bacterium]